MSMIQELRHLSSFQKRNDEVSTGEVCKIMSGVDRVDRRNLETFSPFLRMLKILGLEDIQ